MGHGFDDIEEGERMILTIKDRGILDEDGSTLSHAVRLMI